MSGKKMPTSGPWVGTWRPHERRGPIAALYSSPGPKHGLPSLTGRKNHDPTKQKAPAFSLGLRHGQSSNQCSPGPKYFVPSNVTRNGRNATPSYSLSSRWKEQTVTAGPGPGHYATEKSRKTIFPTVPSYTLSGRGKQVVTKKTPGPADYHLPAVLGAKSVTKPSAPAASIKGRNNYGSFHEDKQKTPGPAAYKVVDTSKFRPKPPQFTIACRRPALEESTRKPGPGAHYPERVTVTKKAAPSISFGLRHSQYIAQLILADD